MRFISLLLLLFLCNILTAQKVMKWGKVSDKELKMTTYDKDSDAAAVVLGDVGSIQYESTSSNKLKVVYRRHTRIKILKHEGLEYANQEISYYYGDKLEQVTQLKAQVFNEGEEKITLKKKDIFDVKENDYWAKKKFTIPNVKEGSIIEFRYTVQSARTTNIPNWYFQREIPTQWSEFSFEYPDSWYMFTELSQGTQAYHIDENKNGSAKFVIASNKGLKTHSEPTRLRRYVHKDLPGLKREPYMTTIRDYSSKVSYQLRDYKIGGISQNFLNSWEKVAKSLYKGQSFGRQLKEGAMSRAVVKAAKPTLAKAGDDPMEKIMAAYSFVVSNVKWNGNNDISIDAYSLDKILEKEEGNSAAMNLMFILLLEEAGLVVKPALTSTRRHGKLTKSYPFIDQFNYVLAYVEIEGKFVLLDATSGAKMPNLLNPKALNHYAWVVDEKKPKWVNINVNQTNTTSLARISIDKEGIVTGDLVYRSDNYQAYFMRRDLNEQKAVASIIDEDLYPKIKDVKIKNQKESNKKLNITAQFSTENAAEINGDLIYINAVLLEKQTENPFKSEKREFPVDMAYPFKDQYILELKVPEGYVVEELPENVSMTLLDKAAKFQFLVTERAGVVKIISKIILTRTVYMPEEYKAIREFYDTIVSKHASQIVFKKK